MDRVACIVGISAVGLFLAGGARAQDAGAPPPPPPENTAPPPASTTPPPATSSASPATTTAHPDQGGQRESGFVFETHAYTQVVAVVAGIGSATIPLVIGGIFGGYKLDRLIIGLGFDFSSVDSPTTGGAQIVMRWIPGIRYALVRSSDDRVELFGQADLGFGHQFNSPANEIIDVDLGLGARYWVHRQFAVSAAGGWTGQWGLTQTPDTSTVVQGMFAGLQLLGVF